MKLPEALDCYHEFSRKVSDLTRQLAFAALGVVWLFKIDGGAGAYHVPKHLIAPALLAILALGLDFMQYLYSAAVWGFLHRIMEKRLHHDPDQEFQVRCEINWIPIGLFWAKAAALTFTYGLLLRYILPLAWLEFDSALR